MFMKIFSAVLLYLIAWLPTAQAQSAAGQWVDIGYSLSGLAKMVPARNGAAYSFIGVIDNKHDDEPRVLMIHLNSDYSLRSPVVVVPWPTPYPSDLTDLESVAAIPNGQTGSNQQFVTANSDGNFWRFTVNDNEQVTNVLQSSKDLYREGSTSSAKEIESLGFFTHNGSIKIAWAGRGSRDHSARLFSADFTSTSSTLSFSNHDDRKIQETHFNWPRPVWGDDDNTRLISDLAIATNPNGAVYVSSAFDGGDNGPFASTLYNIGTFESVDDYDDNDSPYPPQAALFVRGSGKKVEAVEMLTGDPSGGFILGTDDEKLGGYIIVLLPES